MQLIFDAFKIEITHEMYKFDILSIKSIIMTSKDAYVSVHQSSERGLFGIGISTFALKHPSRETHARLCHRRAFLSAMILMENAADNVICLPDDQLMKHLTDVFSSRRLRKFLSKLAPQILAQGKKVIDLSGAFRLKQNDYFKMVRFTSHAEPSYLNERLRIVPFAGPLKAGTRLIANPGCFATAICDGADSLTEK